MKKPNFRIVSGGCHASNEGKRTLFNQHNKLCHPCLFGIPSKHLPIEASIDTGADVNCISQKYIGELGITYHDKSNSIEAPDASYSTLGKVNLHIGFNDSEKHKI